MKDDAESPCNLNECHLPETRLLEIMSQYNAKFKQIITTVRNKQM
jgi:hypothetical protein